jgi:hypothetical protein
MRTMSLLRPILLLALAGSACSSVKGQVSCSSDGDCLTAANTGTGGASPLFPDGAAMNAPVCCNNTCVLPVNPGCDSGFRYLTSAPGYGDCVPAGPIEMCIGTPDLGIPVDLAGSGG